MASQEGVTLCKCPPSTHTNSGRFCGQIFSQLFLTEKNNRERTCAVAGNDREIMNLCSPFAWLFRRGKKEQKVAEHQGHALG